MSHRTGPPGDLVSCTTTQQLRACTAVRGALCEPLSHICVWGCCSPHAALTYVPPGDALMALRSTRADGVVAQQQLRPGCPAQARLFSLVIATVLLSTPATGHVERSTHARHRHLLTDQRSAQGWAYVHVPYISCAVEHQVTPPSTMQPPGCTRTPADCASWCDSVFLNTLVMNKQVEVTANGSTPPALVSSCHAFKYMREDPSPPLVGYSRCVLLTAVNAANCALGLVILPDDVVWQPQTGGSWDYFYRMNLPPADPAMPTVRGEANITGMSLTAAQLQSAKRDGTWLGPYYRLVTAIQTAISARCCATDVRIANITDVSSVTVNVQLEMTASWITDSSPFIAKYIDLALSDAPGAASLLAGIQLSFPNATSVTYAALSNTWLAKSVFVNATPAAAVATSSSSSSGSVIGLTGALAALALLLLCSALYILMRMATKQRPHPGFDLKISVRGAHASSTEAPSGVFVSYRRTDLGLADAVVDQLNLAGLHVFYDRAGLMAGKPFEEELHRAMRESRVTSVLVTVDLMRSLVAHRPDSVDWWLVEVFLAVHYLRTRPGRHIFPLLAGTPSSSDGIAPQRSYLLTDAAFVAYRDALPDIVPTATLALVTRLLLKDAASGGGELDAALQGITVRQFVLGRPGGALGLQPPLTGLLSIAPVSIHGPDDHMGLLLRHRYAERILQALSSAQ